MAYSRHYPAINWLTSYSGYADILEDWYAKNVNENFIPYKKEMLRLLSEENSLSEIAKLVGSDVLPDSQKLILETCRAIRLGFLQQNVFDKIDTFISLAKQYRMMETILFLHEEAKKLIQEGIALSEIKKLGLFEDYIKIKYNIKNDELEKFDELDKKIAKQMKALQLEYKED